MSIVRRVCCEAVQNLSPPWHAAASLMRTWMRDKVSARNAVLSGVGSAFASRCCCCVLMYMRSVNIIRVALLNCKTRLAPHLLSEMASRSDMLLTVAAAAPGWRNSSAICLGHTRSPWPVDAAEPARLQRVLLVAVFSCLAE